MLVSEMSNRQGRSVAMCLNCTLWVTWYCTVCEAAPTGLVQDVGETDRRRDRTPSGLYLLYGDKCDGRDSFYSKKLISKGAFYLKLAEPRGAIHSIYLQVTPQVETNL